MRVWSGLKGVRIWIRLDARRRNFDPTDFYRIYNYQGNPPNRQWRKINVNNSRFVIIIHFHSSANKQNSIKTLFPCNHASPRFSIEFPSTPRIKEGHPLITELSLVFLFSRISGRGRRGAAAFASGQHSRNVRGVNYQRILLHPISRSRENDLVPRQSHDEHRRPSLRARLWICIIHSYTCVTVTILYVCVYTYRKTRGHRIERESERGGERRMLEQEIKIEDTVGRGRRRRRDFRAVDVILCSTA